jgi:hypothetical protein
VKISRIFITILVLVLGRSVGALSQTRTAAPPPCTKNVVRVLLAQVGVIPVPPNQATPMSTYYIRDVRIVDPWSFLRFNSKDEELEHAIAGLKGKPLNAAEVNKVFKLVVDRRLADSMFSYATINLENCSGNQVDVVFKLFSVQVPPVSASTFEFQQLQNDQPEVFANTEDHPKFRIVPTVGFDEPKKLFAGATVLGNFPGARGPVDAVAFEALGPTSLRSGSATAGGSFNSETRIISNAECEAQYDYSALATDRGTVNTGRVVFQANATTRPLKGLVLRFGTQLEGGNQQTEFSPSELAPNTLASSGYSAAKFYAGLSMAQRHHALKASYGIEFGSVGESLHGDWRKHLGDIADEFWFRIGNHRRVEIEQQLTAGTIKVLHTIPAGSLFFGGNREEPFIQGDSWTIRGNPVIRSLPANRFYRTRDGAGAQRFVSYNSTIAITTWRKPLIPTELSSDQDFKDAKDFALGSATDTLMFFYASEDKNFELARKVLPVIAKKLQVLRDAVSTTPSPDACINLIDSAAINVDGAINNHPEIAWGFVDELIPGGGSALGNVVSVCKEGTKEPSVIQAADDLGVSVTDFEAAYNLIDQNAALKKAENDMSYVRRTLDTVIEDVNISSVSPLLVFDVARITPKSSDPFSGTRYGVGVGLRFALVDTIQLSGGYAVNVHRRPGEPSGAFFFSLTNRSLFKF